MAFDAYIAVKTVCCILCVNMPVIGETMFDVEDLMKDKFHGYNKRIRGAFNQTKPTTVDVSLSLVSIQNLDEVQQTLTSLAVLHAAWTDERLIWDEHNYNGVKELSVPQTDLWRPDLALGNSAERVSLLGIDGRMARITSNGSVALSIADVFTTSCSVDVTNYPFDEQSCEIDFVAFGTAKEIMFKSGSAGLDLGVYKNNGQWELTHSRINIDPSYPIAKIMFSLTLKRRAEFRVVTQICPIVLTGLLNIIVFVIPPQSGERISYSITLLLSNAVFFSMVGQVLPSNSDTMAIICYFMLFAIGMSGGVCVGAIFSSRLYFKDEDGSTVPFWLCRICQCVLNRQDKMANSGEEESELETLEVKSESKRNTFTWKDVSFLFDLICFLITVVCCLTASAVCYAQVLGDH